MKPDTRHREILEREFWIFDMDGTLTLAAHDFDAIRSELGLPAGRPILEALDELPESRSAPLHVRLNELELEIAGRSQPAPAAGEFLDALNRRGARLGILTRNNTENAHVTLRAAGLAEFFPHESILTRDDAPPKPDPEGLLRLMKLWKAPAERVIMVGDYLFDLTAGRAAGAATIYIDPAGEFPYREHADVSVRSLAELLT